MPSDVTSSTAVYWALAGTCRQFMIAANTWYLQSKSCRLDQCAHVNCAGIGYSDDKLLQSRIFSYPDTQRHRLGPNYLMLPWNAPKCPMHNNHHEGFMNFLHRDEEVSFAVNVLLAL